MASQAATYLSNQINAHPEQKAVYEDLHRLFQAKLWYQFSQKLVECVEMEHFQDQKRTLDLYNNVVSKLSNFVQKLNSLDLAQIVAAASEQCPREAAPAFIDGALKQLDGQEQALVLLQMAKARQLLAGGKVEEAAKVITEGKKIMDDYMGIMDTLVQALFYRASFELAKVKKQQSLYFQNAMLFLVYSKLDKLKPAELQALAYDIGLAALTGKDIYNYGELLQHPILKVLKGTPRAWLPDLLQAFNKGDINTWNQIFAEKGKQETELKENFKALSSKIRIMAVMDMAFGRESGDRKFDYKEICQRCQIREDEVDLLLIKAFSQNVIKGVIDGCEKFVRITYLQPRVLDKGQLTSMKQSLQKWAETVNETAIFLEANSPELLPKDISTTA